MYPATHTQSLASSLPVKAFELSGHAAHETAPTALVYVPASHAAHESAPTALAYFPASHAVHETAPTALVYFPAAHAAHETAPTALVYFPVSHALHCTPFKAAECPKTHLQSVNAPLPDTELVPSGHVEQTPSPLTDLYFPISHELHSIIPVLLLYVPFRHCGQLIPLFRPDVKDPTGQAVHVGAVPPYLSCSLE